MVCTMFQIIVLYMVIVGNPYIIFCLPLESFMNRDKLNDVIFFYYGDVNKILIQEDLNNLVDNYNQVPFELIKYLDQNYKFFKNNDPKTHYNLILDLQNHYLNYYYSFPFSHNKHEFYKHLSNVDWKNHENNQYWRPYIGVHNKTLVNIKKFNINPHNYMVSTDLKFKICKSLKWYYFK